MAVDTTTIDMLLNAAPPISGSGSEPKYVKAEALFAPGMLMVPEKKAGTAENPEEKVVWNYYPLKVSPVRKGNFHTVEVLPTLLKDGLVCINNTLLHVPVRDLVRKHVNAGRIVAVAEPPNTTETNRSKPPTAASPIVQPILGPDIEPEVSQAIDLAIAEQMRALQYIEDSQKGIF